MDSLNGALDSFPLPDVLRFVAHEGHTGVLRIETGGMTGRVFFVAGRITYATTRGEDGSLEELLASRPVDEARERRGRNPQGRFPRPLGELVRQQIVEVLVRLGQSADGRFWFVADVRTRAHGDGPGWEHDVDEILGAADQRALEWKTLDPIVRDGKQFCLRPRLLENAAEVVIGRRAWEYLAAVGAGGSAEQIAERLGTFEFSAATMLAELVRAGLVVPADEVRVLASQPQTVVLPLESEAG